MGEREGKISPRAPEEAEEAICCRRRPVKDTKTIIELNPVIKFTLFRWKKSWRRRRLCLCVLAHSTRGFYGTSWGPRRSRSRRRCKFNLSWYATPAMHFSWAVEQSVDPHTCYLHQNRLCTNSQLQPAGDGRQGADSSCCAHILPELHRRRPPFLN